MNQNDRIRIERGAYSLHRLGPVATAEFLTDVADRIGGLPCILGSLAECERRNERLVRRAAVSMASPKREAAR
jgi:hypothetical protein